VWGLWVEGCGCGMVGLGDVGGGGWTNRWVCRKYKKENNNTINQHFSLFHPITSLQPPENSVNRKFHHSFHPPFPLPIPSSSISLRCNPVKSVHLATRKRERGAGGFLMRRVQLAEGERMFEVSELRCGGNNGEGDQRAQISKKKRTHQPDTRRRKRARASKNDEEPGMETGKNDKDTYNPKPLKPPKS